MAFTLSNAGANACAGDNTNKGIQALIASGAKLKFYTGSVPADADASLGAAVLAATVTCNFGTGTNGVLTAGTFGAGTVQAGGPHTVTFFRLTTSGDAVMGQGTVTGNGGGGDIDFGTTPYNVWATGGSTTLSALSLTVPPH